MEFVISTPVANSLQNTMEVTNENLSAYYNETCTLIPPISYNNSTFKPLPNNGLNDQLIGQISIFLNCFLLHVLSLLGIIANILNILILSRHTFKETTTILLLSLSINDLMCSLTQPYRRLECFFEQFNPLVALTVRSISVVFLFNIPDVFVSISICHTTAIAIERVVAVCFPFHVSRIFTPYRVKWMIAFLYIYSITMLSPMLIILDYVWIYDPKFNATRGAYVLNKFYLDRYEALNLYANTGLTNLFTSSTLLTILICSIVIWVRLMFGRRKDLAKMVAPQVKDTRVVKMLLTVCVVTFCVSLPTAIIQMYTLYSNISILTTGKLHYLLRSLICCIYQFNASINFIIYVTMSSKFAKTYRRFFYSLLRKRDKKPKC